MSHLSTGANRYHEEKNRRVRVEKKLSEAMETIEEQAVKIAERDRQIQSLVSAFQPTLTHIDPQGGTVAYVNCGTSSNNRTCLSRWVNRTKIWGVMKWMPAAVWDKEQYTPDVKGSICHRLTKLTVTPKDHHEMVYYFNLVVPVTFLLFRRHRDRVTTSMRNSYQGELST